MPAKQQGSKSRQIEVKLKIDEALMPEIFATFVSLKPTSRPKLLHDMVVRLRMQEHLVEKLLVDQAVRNATMTGLVQMKEVLSAILDATSKLNQSASAIAEARSPLSDAAAGKEKQSSTENPVVGRVPVEPSSTDNVRDQTSRANERPEANGGLSLAALTSMIDACAQIKPLS
jgi:hypothetical protein